MSYLAANDIPTTTVGPQLIRVSRGATEVEILEQRKAELFATYGKRTDFIGPGGKVVPYLPPPYAEWMYRDYRDLRDLWLEQAEGRPLDLPTEIVEPARIKRYVANMFAIVYEAGSMSGYRLRTANLEAGPKGGIVLKARATYDFLDNATRLAIHLDSILSAGAQSPMSTVVGAIKTAAKAAVDTVATPIESLFRIKIPWWVKWGSVGFVGLYAWNISRESRRSRQ